MMKISLLVICLAFLLSACSKNKIEIKEQTAGGGEPFVSRVGVEDNTLVLHGTNLNGINKVAIDNSNYSLKLLSKTKDKATYTIEGALNFKLENLTNLIISSAEASTNVVISLSSCSIYLGGKNIDCNIVPQNGQVLAFDAGLNKWMPKTISTSSGSSNLDLTLYDSKPYECDGSKIGKVVLNARGSLCSCSRNEYQGLGWFATDGNSECVFEQVVLCPDTLESISDKVTNKSYKCSCDSVVIDVDNEIFGSEIFSAKSSICQSAAFLGLFEASRGGTIYYTPVLGRDSYDSAVYHADPSVSSKTDSASSVSLQVGYHPIEHTGKLACVKSEYDGNFTNCNNAGFNYQGSGLYGKCYQLFNLDETPNCSDWIVLN